LLAAGVGIPSAGALVLRRRERRVTRNVSVAERRRLARDLHDSLAQELAFIVMLSQQLDAEQDPTTVSHLKTAGQRALQDARAAITALSSPDDVPLCGQVAGTVQSFRSRFDVQVDLDLDERVVVDAERRSGLLRILQEAMNNAVRHGSARRIGVRLSDEGGNPLLSIADDGAGFDVAGSSAGEGFGLVSMRERAELLGGGLNVVSNPGRGTLVEVRLR
jgi:signal transduction histidine kinase